MYFILAHRIKVVALPVALCYIVTHNHWNLANEKQLKNKPFRVQQIFEYFIEIFHMQIPEPHVAQMFPRACIFEKKKKHQKH